MQLAGAARISVGPGSGEPESFGPLAFGRQQAQDLTAERQPVSVEASVGTGVPVK
jgi:hypothetical protein